QNILRGDGAFRFGVETTKSCRAGRGRTRQKGGARMNLCKRIKNALWAILGLLATVFLFWRQKRPPDMEKAEQVLDESKKSVAEIAKNKANREKQAADLKEKLK